MKVLIFFLLIANVFSADDFNSHGPTVTTSSIQIRNAPYYANIVKYHPFRRSYLPICAAVIISALWLTSAFTCMRNVAINTRKIRTGFDQYEWMRTVHKEKLLHEIESVTEHPLYHEDTYITYHDICLIKLLHQLKIKKYKQKPVALPSSDHIPEVGSEILIVGLGLQRMRSNEPNSLPTYLLAGRMLVMDPVLCARMYHSSSITRGLFCAMMETYSTKIEIGDRGGPAVQDSQLVGIFSSGSTELRNRPVVFTTVHRYLEWIDNVTGLNSNKPRCKNAFLKCYKA